MILARVGNMDSSGINNWLIRRLSTLHTYISSEFWTRGRSVQSSRESESSMEGDVEPVAAKKASKKLSRNMSTPSKLKAPAPLDISRVNNFTVKTKASFPGRGPHSCLGTRLLLCRDLHVTCQCSGRCKSLYTSITYTKSRSVPSTASKVLI